MAGAGWQAPMPVPGQVPMHVSGQASGQWESSPGMVPTFEDETEEQLIAKVKELQKHDLVGRDQWITFADQTGGGRRDPAKHGADALRLFLSGYASGMRLQGEEEGCNMPQVTKLLQKRITSFKDQWSNYCLLYGGGLNDPLKHEPSFHVQFFDQLARCAMGMGAGRSSRKGKGTEVDVGKGPRTDSGKGMSIGMDMGKGMGMGMSTDTGRSMGMDMGKGKSMSKPMDRGIGMGMSMGMDGGPSSKRLKGDKGTPVGAGGTGDPKRDALVAAVKAFKRLGDDQKQAWWNFCDQELSGVRDPARHEVATLQRFADAYCLDVQAAEAASLAFGMTGMAGAASFGMQCAGMSKSMDMGTDMNMGMAMGMDGGPPPKRLKGGKGAALGGGGSGDPRMDALVAAVKAFKRLGDDQKQAWWNYCDRELSGVRDPARHEVATLQRFADAYGLDVQAAAAASPAFGMTGMAGAASFGMHGAGMSRSTDMGMGMSMVTSMGMDGGPPPQRTKGGKGTTFGAGGTGDPTRDALVAAVKAYQRQGDDQKQVWWNFCDTELSGVRDPARHEVATLRRFADAYGLDVQAAEAASPAFGVHGMAGAASFGMEGTGAAAMMDPIKAQLVQRVKNFQKLGEAERQMWYNHCGHTRDPARHDAAELQEFLNTYVS
eukprot:CAMPEP_0117485710 /NCGR_PEP_ID=MMETSP0784-20121206/15104_1 /TAXON_ID=39447 /ORGANISM="" /LENGTH=657 /DNA_ID=CAMNT_0005280303 /DNA_START=32 /DNA_END=2005 /DNA_ORIENTATION=-